MNNNQSQDSTEVNEANLDPQTDESRRQESGAMRASASPNIVIRRIIYYIAGVIITLLALRVLLLLMAANQGTPFVDLVYGLSGMFAQPFYSIFSYQPSYGRSVFEVSSVVAIIVYGLVAHGLATLFTLTRSRQDI